MHSPQRARPGSPCVFLIEDDEDNRAMYLEYLTSIGRMRVIETASSETAFDEVLARGPDVVVTDYAMPKVDGLALCRQLREHPLTRRIPIIMVTGDLRATNSERVRNLCAAVLLKPCDPMALVTEILAVAPRA